MVELRPKTITIALNSQRQRLLNALYNRIIKSGSFRVVFQSLKTPAMWPAAQFIRPESKSQDAWTLQRSRTLPQLSRASSRSADDLNHHLFYHFVFNVAPCAPAFTLTSLKQSEPTKNEICSLTSK